MDLFEKKEKQKEILDGGKKVVLTIKSKGKYIVEVTPGSINVTQKGMMNVLTKGIVGSKTFSINRLSGVQYKKPGLLTGYLQFILMGSGEGKGGVNNAVTDENTILFATNKEATLMEELKEFIEYSIENPGRKPSSDLNDLKKLKNLLDDGILTQDEFTAKKKQILGL